MSESDSSFDQGAFLTHLHKGKEYFDQDQLQKAREELEAAYQLRPYDEKVLNMLGMTYYKLEMLPEAEQMYVILAAGNPEVYALQSNLGLIQLKLNKLQEARDALNRALELQPTNSKAHFYMGLLYEKEELWEEALYHFEQANAEKMVAKVRMKLEEKAVQAEILSPFEVVEILPAEAEAFTQDDFDEILRGSSTQAPAPEAETESEITGRMRSQDLAEAMFQIHRSDEIVRPEELFASGEEHEPEPQETARLSVETPETSKTEPELIEEEALDDEIIIEEATWQKTDPAFFPEPEPVVHAESSVLMPAAVEEPFFLSEEVAADISTFLAQSRPEHLQEEDVFFEATSPELTVFRTSEMEKTQEHAAPLFEESRIPTPEEVENEVREEPELPPILETPVPLPVEAEASTPVESLEELTEELKNELLPPPETATEEEEDLEVNFAVTEDEEEAPAEQGFLEPSPLTPESVETETEQTRDMEYVTSEMHPKEEEVVAEPAGFVAAEVPDDHESVAASVEPTQEPEIEEPEVVESAANLDQFSRDRLYIQPLIGSDRFLLIDPHLLEIIISDQLICRIGTISSYTGNLQFTPWEEQKEKVPLIVVTGTGILFLADRRKEIFLISLNNETLYVESNHLLVAQSSLKVEPQIFQQKGSASALSIVKISGRGTLALTCQTKPLTLNVHEGLPANIPAQAVIAWSGKLTSTILDEELRKIMMSADDEAMFLRFTGAGDVVVEQGGLWGDRRTRR